ILFHQPLPRWMLNSFLVTLSSVAVSTFIALLAAYAAVFGRFRGHRLFLSTFFRTVPQELIEAASSEGAGPFTVLRRIVLPLSGAATFTLVIVQAIWVWNELMIALVFLQNENSRTLMAGLTQF